MKAETTEFGKVRLIPETDADRAALYRMRPPRSIVVAGEGAAGGLITNMLLSSRDEHPRWILREYLKEAEPILEQLLDVVVGGNLEDNAVLVEETRKLLRLFKAML